MTTPAEEMIHRLEIGDTVLAKGNYIRGDGKIEISGDVVEIDDPEEKSIYTVYVDVDGDRIGLYDGNYNPHHPSFEIDGEIRGAVLEVELI